MSRVLSNIKSITVAFLWCNVIRCSTSNDAPTDCNVEYTALVSDGDIKFNVKSEFNRCYFEGITCGNSVFYPSAEHREQSAFITGLMPCKRYECQVEVGNKYTSEKFMRSKKITTGFNSKTLPIKLLKVTPEPNAIRVDLDFQQIECIDSFYVVLDNSKPFLWTKHNLTKILKISELSPCVAYHLFVLFNHESGTHTIFNNIIRTSSLKLERIEHIEFNPKTDLLRWTSVYLDDCTTKYMITIIAYTNDETIFLESERNQYNLNFLGGCAKFHISIKPRDQDALFGSIHIETGYRRPQSAVQNVQVKMLNKTAVLIKWDRPAKNPACAVDYAIQINRIWIITSSLEHEALVYNSSQNLYISICLVVQRTTDNCVAYNFDTNSNKLTEALKVPNGSAQIPPFYRMISWGSIIINDITDKDAKLQINDQITSLSNINFSLVISERTCGSNLVPSYQMFGENNTNNQYTPIDTGNCTRMCEFHEILIEIQLSEADLFSCNSPNHNYIALRAGTTYEIMARIFTPLGYTDTIPIVFPRDRVLADQQLNIITLISISGVCIFSLLVLLGIVLYCRNRKRTVETWIEVQHYCSFYKTIDTDLITREFRSINNTDSIYLPTTAAETEMFEKNRSPDIIPYDYNRVDISTGYINASYINGYKCEKQYIASQGPTEHTVSDFWHMIVEQQCDGIVMLTNLIENSKAQCYQYYPDKNNTFTVNGVTIRNIEEIVDTYFIKRILQISYGKIGRYIVHYQYTAWPAGDCAEDGFDLIEFVENTGSQNSQSSHPILVHASLGVGRTGTYIALDLLFQQVREERYISVFETVKKLRTQRCRMVETIDQYRFLYDCINKYYLTRKHKRKSSTV